MSEIMCYKCKNGTVRDDLGWQTPEECQYCHDDIWRGYWMTMEKEKCYACEYCSWNKHDKPCCYCNDGSEFVECSEFEDED